MSKRMRWLVVAVALGVGFTRPARAYLDPAAGSMMLQLVLAGLAGLAVAVKLLWGRLLALFGVRRRPEPADGAGPESQGGV